MITFHYWNYTTLQGSPQKSLIVLIILRRCENFYYFFQKNQ